MVLWGVCLRVVIGLHATWLVNSATHMWGSRRFETRDDSRNSWWVALITFGEGWHNNHHAHPTSARHGLAWYEFDISWIQIEILRFLGVAKGVKVAKVTSGWPSATPRSRCVRYIPGILFCAALSAAPPARFAEHTVATGLKGGYQVVAIDMNHDGKPDLVALASGMTELVWFENPGWQRHVIAGNLSGMINLAAWDVGRRRHSRNRAGLRLFHER